MVFRRGVAFDTILRSNQAVIKAGILPVVNGVAGRAVCSIRASVGVVASVAGNTCCGRTLVGFAGMAT